MPFSLCAFLVSLSLLRSCTPVREAQQTIAKADSLRFQTGVMIDDSLALADAVRTLHRVRLFRPDDYARACYYYGRLLANSGNEADAMQTFLNGTNAPYIQRVIPLPNFTDYSILGRIYSNIATMCHLFDNFPWGYSMFELSANSFLLAGDTTLYYYQRNAMALELAEQNMHDETLSLLTDIEHECTDIGVNTKLWETKAILYKNLAQYDSAIYAAKELYSRGYYAATGYVVEAQAFWHLEQFDSALFYAKRVMEHPYAASHDKYNMLYILTYNDSTLNQAEIKSRSEERADIDKEILDPLNEQLAQAAALLKQDMEITYDKTWIVVLILTVLCALTVYWVIRKRRIAYKQELLQKEQTFEERMQNILEKESNVYEQINRLDAQQKDFNEHRIQEIENLCDRLRASKNLKRTLHLSNYNAMRQMLNLQFNKIIDKMEESNLLTQREIQFCVLVLINIPQKQIAELLVYSENSIKATKSNIAKKMKVSSSALRNHLISIVLQ